MMEMKVFQEMPYERPDLETYAQAIRQATAAMKDAKTYEEARQAYFDLQAAGEQVETMFSLAHVRNTIDTQDAYYEGEIKWLRENNARMIPLEKAYHEAFATCAFRADFEQEFGEQLLKDVDASLKTSDERLIEDTIRLGELSQEYQKVSAMAETEFRGEKCNFYGLLKHMESTDREERKEAFHAWSALYERISPDLDREYDEMVRIRDHSPSAYPK